MGKAEEVLPEFYERGGSGDGEDMLHPDVIVVDPPRKGCDEKCLTTMLRMQPGRIVYVSCDPGDDGAGCKEALRRRICVKEGAGGGPVREYGAC